MKTEFSEDIILKKLIKSKVFYKFFIGALLGVLLFLIPIPQGKGYNLVLGLIAEGILSISRPIIPYILSIAICLSCVILAVHRIKSLEFIKRNDFLKSIFEVDHYKFIVRIIGSIFFILSVFKVGPEIIWSANTGGTMLGLLVTLSIWYVISFYLISLLLDFGAMDFLGTLIRKIVRPLFTLPGRSAIDCIASWIGNGPLGVMITKFQYDDGYYTNREASVIASCFSIVSITFCVIVAKTLEIVDKFLFYYLTVCLVTFICAIILPRIYPLNKIKDEYNPKVGKKINEDVINSDNMFKNAVKHGMDRAKEASFIKIIKRGNETTIDVFLTLYPTIMIYGTIILIIVTYTPILTILSYPLIYILQLFNVPFAVEAAPTMIVGFADMFLPAILGSGIPSEMTRFIIGCVSIVQLIYMTETGSIILRTKEAFNLNFGKLLIIFLLRTAISLPIIIGVANIIY